MKKHLLATLVALILCLAAVSGCSLVGMLEKDVNVVFEVDGKYVDGVTVNAFNNAIAPVFDEDAEGAVPEGYKFMGWSAAHDWEYGDDKDLLISSGGIVRYVFVKDYANEGGTVVAKPVIIDKNTIPKADLVIAWYGNASNSGISQENMDAFEAELRAYLAAEGVDLGSTEIVIRSYAGNVGASCGSIRKDDDVDIMLGWSDTGNLTGTGGMVAGDDVLENVDGITIGSKTRYAARLTDRELGVKVYGWIQEKYGNGSVPEILTPAEPTPEPEPTPKPEPNPDEPTPNPGEPTPTPTPSFTLDAFTETKLVIGWWNYETSGLTDAIIAKIQAGLEKLLQENGKEVTSLELVFRAYDNDKVGASGTAIKNDNDVDIVFGWNNTLSSKGGVEIKQSISGVQMGVAETKRNIDLLDDTNDFALAVHKWFKTADAQALFV